MRLSAHLTPCLTHDSPRLAKLQMRDDGIARFESLMIRPSALNAEPFVSGIPEMIAWRFAC